MKEFNLEEAKAGKPVCTREGMPARIVCWDLKFGKNNKYTLLALIKDEDGDEMPMSYTSKGHLINDVTKDKYDLMMVGKKCDGWVNIYRDGRGDIQVDNRVFSTKEDAIRMHFRNYLLVDTIHIEWEE